MALKNLRKLSLHAKFGLLSLIPIVLLGAVLGGSLKGLVRERALSDAGEKATLTARLGLQTRLKPGDVRSGLGPTERARVDRALRPALSQEDALRVVVWNRRREPVYSDGRRSHAQARSRELESALGGRLATRMARGGSLPGVSSGVDQVLRVYVPLRFPEGGDRPAGAFEVWLNYDPIAARIDSDARKRYLILLIGLVLLYGVLFRIATIATRELRRQAEEREHQALHDPLTGLPNRAYFHDLVERAAAVSRRHKRLAAVLLMDLDRFKEINDTLGHVNGDQLLQRIGARWRGVLRASDTIARLGGDEFAVLLPDMPDHDSVAEAAERLLEALKEPFVVGGLALEVEASIGIALYPEHGKRVSALLRAADVAMYAAKDAHSGSAFYSPDQHKYNPQRLALVSELRRAIDEDELVLHYQPKADIATRRINGVEALARWEHPQRGLLPPDEFVPLAEHTSLLRPMTIHLLDLALRQARVWRDEGLELAVSVNLSMRNLLDLQLPDDVHALLRQADVPASALELEITESMVMAEPKRTLAVLNRLNRLGVRLTIDDFGTGYSSLAYLKQLPVTSIKIDKSFVLGMAEDPGDAVIVESTVHLGHNLGLEVVAEGVETDDVWNRLAELGCDTAQGFYLSKAVPFPELTRWLSAYESLIASPDASGNGHGLSAPAPASPSLSGPPHPGAPAPAPPSPSP